MPNSRNSFAKATLAVIFTASLVVLVALVVMNGRQDHDEVEDLAYIMALGLDRSQDGLLELTAQIAVPAHGGGGESGSGANMPIMLAVTHGKTVLEALRSLSQTSSKAPFWGQARVVIFGEQLAREGLAPVLDILSRNYETRRLMWVMVTPGTAREVLEVKPEMENLPALLLAGLETQAQRHSLAPQTTLHKFLVSVASTAEEPYAAAIRVEKIVEPVKSGKAEGGGGQGGGAEGGGTKSELILDGCGVFQFDRLVGWLNGMESRGLAWLRGDAMAGVIGFDDPATGIKGSVEVTRSSAELMAKVDANDLAATQINVRIRAEGRLTEYFAGPSVSDKSTMDKLDDIVASHIMFEAQQALARLQGEYRTDVIGLGEVVRERLSNAAWSQIRQDWPNIFPKIKVNVAVDFKLRRHGMTIDRLIPNTQR